MRLIATTLLLTLTTIALGETPEKSLLVHEWGTFTSLQNDRGESIGGINIDDEPVPAFVHGLDASLVMNSPTPDEIKLASMLKGVFPKLHPDITMRLETPVVYFYDRRPMGGEGPMKVDLSVTFHGGYLTQYYPSASGPVPVVTRDWTAGQYAPVKSDTTHTLTWNGLEIGKAGEGPKTTDRVWTAPREVKADNVVAANGESEKFVFYRGVGHLDSPLKLIRDASGETGQFVLEAVDQKATIVPDVWLIDIRPDGTSAIRTLPAVREDPTIDRQVPSAKLTFEEGDYTASHQQILKTAMHDSLVKAGLFEDEATAMLNTWEASYFKSPGLRVFYIVPPGWTERVLPLSVSVSAEITRVMVGRIELVSPAQARLLQTISAAGDLPKLGRFAGALINDEQRRSPSPRLATLIESAGLQPAKIAR
jgi:hypothetical protein